MEGVVSFANTNVKVINTSVLVYVLKYMSTKYEHCSSYGLQVMYLP